jgi:homoserine kinase type II
MAVYTDIADDELQAFLATYDLAPMLALHGIAEGVENSNYLLITANGPLILTLYEKRVDPADLPFFLGLMGHLAGKGLPSPRPIANRQGQPLMQLAGRSAALFSFLPGNSAKKRIERFHCAGVGNSLARIHLAAQDFAPERPNALGLKGWHALANASLDKADSVAPGLAAGITAELAFLAAHWPVDLPRGIIHADLFPDNLLFTGETVSGIIDFYFACTDFLAYDLAIALNAWCFEPGYEFNATKSRALVTAYQAVRPLAAAEVSALPILARGAALRFLLSRLYDWLHPIPGAYVKPKDPLEYWAKLHFHQATTSAAEYGIYE